MFSHSRSHPKTISLPLCHGIPSKIALHVGIGSRLLGKREGRTGRTHFLCGERRTDHENERKMGEGKGRDAESERRTERRKNELTPPSMCTTGAPTAPPPPLSSWGPLPLVHSVGLQTAILRRFFPPPPPRVRTHVRSLFLFKPCAGAAAYGPPADGRTDGPRTQVREGGGGKGGRLSFSEGETPSPSLVCQALIPPEKKKGGGGEGVELGYSRHGAGGYSEEERNKL